VETAALSIADLDGPLPFHLLLDRDLTITAVGPGLQKLISKLSSGDRFQDRFKLARPHHDVQTAQAIEKIDGRLILVESKDTHIQLRGAFWSLNDKHGFLFASSPLMNKAEDLDRLGLLMTDFAPHDPVTDFLFAIRARDVTLDEIRGAIDRQQLLTRELDHRVKNTLAAVLTLVSLTSNESSNIDEFASRFEGRVRAMSMAHELLANTGWKEVELETLVATVLGGFLQDQSGVLTINGPRATIGPRQAGPLAMAIHELGMNAFKYGAWSNRKGCIEVDWTIERGNISITWAESGGPPIAAPSDHGVGLGLVTGFIQHELRGKVKIDFNKSGLHVWIQFPHESIPA
jgi:two-component sensor histidine kinase